MDGKEQTIFRKKTLDRISSPEQLTDYLSVTSIGIWVVLVTVILLLTALFAWSAIGILETTAPVKVVVHEHTAKVVTTDTQPIKEGMPLRVVSVETTIVSTEKDEYGRIVGKAEVSLADGIYDGTLVVDQTKPFSFLLEGR